MTDHATPVGSGTVARTKRIPVEQRAEAAVIAWLRHQTTGYDSMKIARIKGKRREVRRMLAQRSKELLGRYRRGESVGEDCPLKKALEESLMELIICETFGRRNHTGSRIIRKGRLRGIEFLRRPTPIAPPNRSPVSLSSHR